MRPLPQASSPAAYENTHLRVFIKDSVANLMSLFFGLVDPTDVCRAHTERPRRLPRWQPRQRTHATSIGGRLNLCSTVTWLLAVPPKCSLSWTLGRVQYGRRSPMPLAISANPCCRASWARTWCSPRRLQSSLRTSHGGHDLGVECYVDGRRWRRPFIGRGSGNVLGYRIVYMHLSTWIRGGSERVSCSPWLACTRQRGAGE